MAIPDPEGFDEAYYLAENPDVAAVVETGDIPSGWWHYERHGHGEGRLGAPIEDIPPGAWPELPREPAQDTLDVELLIEKGRLEVEMRVAPRDLAIREQYFHTLWMVASSHFGIFAANLPEIRTPLLFRGGGSDVSNLRQIFVENWIGEHEFQYGDYAVPLRTPRRILDLGAYVGYTTVYFANRFPDARIIAVEPSAVNFAVLRANTACYPNIICRHAAIWHEPTRVTTTMHYFGDWGSQFAAVDRPAEGKAVANTISEVMAIHNWERVDFIKCILEGEQVPVLTAEDRPWYDGVDCVATKPTPAGSFPREEDEPTLRMAFPRHLFDTCRHGEMFFFLRRESALVAEVPTIRLAPSLPEYRRYAAANVGPFEFHRFAEAGIRLVPNAPDEPRAEVAFTLHFSGQTRFETTIVAHPGDDGTVSFHVVINDATTQMVHRVASRTIPVGTTETWAFTVPMLTETCVVTLATERSDEAAVWADFVDPRLV